MPRIIGSGATRRAAGIRWLTPGYTSELVTSSATASPLSNFALAAAGSIRGAIVIIGGAPVAPLGGAREKLPPPAGRERRIYRESGGHAPRRPRQPPAPRARPFVPPPHAPSF